ncbi:DegV family protein [Streptococcus pluranimalium]
MKIAVVTDNSAHLPSGIRNHPDLHYLQIPVTFGDQPYLEEQDPMMTVFYQQMAAQDELPKTSQPSLAAFDNLLIDLKNEGYTHVLGLFLSSGISGFWANSQFLIEEHNDLTVAIPDTKITSAPLGFMVETALTMASHSVPFDLILDRLNQQITKTTAFIVVDNLNHLVKGGRLSNGSALLGNLLSIKPILYFNDQGVIEVYEKVRTEKKALKRLMAILREMTNDGRYDIAIIHANAAEKAKQLRQQLAEEDFDQPTYVVPFGSVIATHLGEGAIAFGITPKV